MACGRGGEVIAAGSAIVPVRALGEEFEASTLRGVLRCIAAVNGRIDVVFDADMEVPANLTRRKTSL